MSDKLKCAREIINEVDRDMAALFVRRMEAARLVAEYKSEMGLEIYDKRREDEVIRRNSAYVEDEELKSFYVTFLNGVMSVSRSYQSVLMEGMRVAYSGTVGAFAHIATMKLFPTAKKVAYPSFEDAYRAVENGECDVAVLPTENSYNGEVGQVTDLMFSGSLYVNGVTELEISQDLLGVPGATVGDIKEVISHAQALGQCAEYIKRHGLTTREYSNTALAAEKVSELGDRSIGAIASSEAAEIFGLSVLERNINESRTNTTKFAVFGRTMAKPKSEMGVHTILLFTVRHEAGALAKAIDVIGRHGFNMKCLRSRPMKELLWQYYFYVEAEGDIDSPDGVAMLEELGEYCDRLRVVGNFLKK